MGGLPIVTPCVTPCWRNRQIPTKAGCCERHELRTDQVMDVLMPQLGETVAEGKIIKCFKSAGEEVKPGDNLFEIETDKVSMEVPSTTTGVLAEIRVPA